MPDPVIPVREVHRLSASAYQQLEKRLPGPVPRPDASPQHVGFLLGIQHVLAALREGYTLES